MTWFGGDEREERHEREEIRLLREIAHTLHRIEHALVPKVVAKFIITQGDQAMPTQGPLTGLAPGATGTFTATPVAGDGSVTTVPTGIVPVWSSDDTGDVLTVAPDGLSTTVVANPGATPGSTHTLSVALPDGSANSPVGLPILTTTPQPVAGFVITQA